jgi:hypothetical protein
MIDPNLLALGLAFLGGFLGGEMVAMLTDLEFYMAGWACACAIACIAMSRWIHV